MKVLIIVNGLDYAFLQEFGCTCSRCVNHGASANTSVSLLILDDHEKVLHHVLFDAGMGVVNSLNSTPIISGDNAKLDWLFLSHWHPDHVLDLNRLCETWRRTLNRRGGQWKPIPTWCREGTGKWLQKNYSFEWNNFLAPQVKVEYNPPGIKLDVVPIGIDHLTITPISVSHCTADIKPKTGIKSFCSASFVIEIKAEKETKKIVLLWDIDNKNNWIETPDSIQEKTVELMSDADYLFIDCNTWSVEEINGKNTGHISFSTVQRYVKKLCPEKTFLVHLSGHEDGKGNDGWGWNNKTWEINAKRIWQLNNLPGNVCVPLIRQQIQI